MNQLIRVTILTIAVAAFAGGAVAAENETSHHRESVLTLEAAIQRALGLSPRLKSAGHSVSAADARAQQAGLWPNPEFDFEVENFAGDGPSKGFEAAESTLMLSQPFPLGGKPGRRRAVAQSEAQLARRDLEAIHLDIIADVKSAFAGVIASQQRHVLTKKLLQVSKDFARIVQARVDAGKVSPVEATRAQIEVSRVGVALARASRALNASRILLAATWGSTEVTFDRAAGDLPEPADPPSLEELREMMMDAPEMERLDDEIERQKRSLAFEKSLSIPDLALGVGPRRFEETGHSAWVAGLSLSIPLFDRNQGSRRAAEFEIERVNRAAESSMVALEAELAVTVEKLTAAAEAARSIQTDLVPATTRVQTAVETGYREGKFGFIDVIAAQRTFFEASTLLLESLEEYALTRVDLERLVGGSLESATDPGPPAKDTDGEK